VWCGVVEGEADDSDKKVYTQSSDFRLKPSVKTKSPQPYMDDLHGPAGGVVVVMEGGMQRCGVMV
jgi:hypothetical protein